jgi:hypothetical protein
MERNQWSAECYHPGLAVREDQNVKKKKELKSENVNFYTHLTVTKWFLTFFCPGSTLIAKTWEQYKHLDDR